MISDFLNIAFSNIKKKKFRAFLTLLGILISIATIFVLISLSLGLEKSIQEQFETLGTDKFFVQPRGQFGPPGSATAATLTEDDVEAVEKVSGVKAVATYTIGNAKIQYRDTQKFVMVIGIEPDDIDVAFGSYDVDGGRFIKSGDKFHINLGSQYQYKEFLGQNVELGKTVEIQDIEFKVVGFIEETGSTPDDRQVYMPLDALREVFDIPERVDAIVVQVNDPDEIDEVADEVDRRLEKFRDVDEDTKDYSILTPEQLLESFGNVLNIVTIFLAGIAAISLLVGGINIATAMFTSVLERTKEIGVMKAIGAENSDILWIFVIEAGLLGTVGGVLGILFGMGVGKAIEAVAAATVGSAFLSVTFPWYLIVGCLAFAFIAGAASGIWPAWRATQIKPVQALRYE
jgi:putative ABC transport system permease protein